MTVSIRHAAGLIDKVAAFGVAIPTELAAALAVADTLKTAARRPIVELDGVVARGTAKQVAAALADYGQQQAAATAIAERIGLLQVRAAERFARAFHGSAGDQLIDGLRPHFDEAAAGIAHARDLLGPEPTPDRVLELGDEAAAAWRELPQHRQTLDRIWSVVDSLRFNFDLFAAAPHLRPDAPPIAMVVAPERRPLDEIAVAFYKESGTVRGGRWLRTAAAVPLRLNSITDAVAEIARQNDAAAELVKPRQLTTIGD